MPTTFKFAPYEPAYAPTIAQVLGLPAQAQAQAVRNIAEAQARSGATRMQIAGQTGQAITSGVNQAMGNVGELLQLKRDAPVRALQIANLAAQVGESQQKLLSAQEATRLHADMREAFKVGVQPDGGVNLGKVEAELLRRGHPEAAMEVRKQIAAEGGKWTMSDGVIYNTNEGPDSAKLIAAKPPNASTLAVDAANPNSPTHDASAQALRLLHPTPETHSQEATFMLPGRGIVKGEFVPGVGDKPGQYRYQGQDVSGQVQAPPPASIQVLNSPVNQERLEQQYRQVLMRPLSFRSGGLGLEDQKVNQGLHLLALFDQTKDAQGNYHISRVMQNELALGLARLISPNGQVGIELEKEVNQRTVASDLAGLVTYLTGTPVTGNTQQILKMFRDSIIRQARVAESNRQSYLEQIKAMAPTDLDEDRRAKVEKSLQMNTLDHIIGNEGKAAPTAGQSDPAWIDLGGGVRVRAK